MIDPLRPVPAAELLPSPRLIRDGKLFSRVAAAGLIAMSAVAVLEVGAMLVRSNAAGMLHGGFAFSIDLGRLDASDPPDPRFVPIAAYRVWQSSLAAVLLALRLAPGLVVVWNLYRLFDSYGRGQVFTTRNERCVGRIALALVGYAFVPLITHAALFLAGMSDVAVKLEVRQLDALIAGLILLAVARVVSFGCAIDDDRSGFV